ncbi:hypothetical protein ANN_12713 [Periplaneta americana]|uniref:Uncharacterized protein n=1 Tax=Periplaneta americana TaxID=6978 RepID=A0ABQ8TJW6_PERAM|nr:hypothetical protein ANN_12713 [Periplaneta americana]
MEKVTRRRTTRIVFFTDGRLRWTGQEARMGESRNAYKVSVTRRVDSETDPELMMMQNVSPGYEGIPPPLPQRKRWVLPYAPFAPRDVT